MHLNLDARAPWFRLGRHDGEGEGAEGAGGGQGTGDGTQTDEGKPEKTFTQAELDRHIADRLARQKAQFGDYDDLKSKASKFDELEQAQKSELEREREARAAAEAAAAKANETATETLRRAAIIAEAAKAGAVDPDAAYALLEDKAALVVEDGKVAGVADAVAALLEAKPYLKAQQGSQRGSGGANQGTQGGGQPADLRTADKATFTAEMAKLGLRPR